MKKEVEAIVEVKPEQDLKSITVINDILVSKTGIVEENEVENTNLQKHSHQLVKQDSDAKHFKADQNGCWVRCEEPWSDPAEGDSLCIFYEAQLRKYPCEMELEAEALFLICLLCEVQSMKTWCPLWHLQNNTAGIHTINSIVTMSGMMINAYSTGQLYIPFAHLFWVSWFSTLMI